MAKAKDWDYEAIGANCRIDAQGELWLKESGRAAFEAPGICAGWELSGRPRGGPGVRLRIDGQAGRVLSGVRNVLQAASGRVDISTPPTTSAQSGLIISLEMAQAVMPRQASFQRHFKYGVKVFYHSCGAIEPIIPYLVDIGVDMLNRCSSRTRNGPVR